MSEPITLDIPHSLGKVAVRHRLDSGIGKIGQIIPGGGQVTHAWDGDTMNFTVSALGQTMACKATVFEDKVHAEVDLPPMFALFAGKIRDALGQELPCVDAPLDSRGSFERFGSAGTGASVCPAC